MPKIMVEEMAYQGGRNEEMIERGNRKAASKKRRR